jgi:GAF domain-containing protein
MFNRLATNLARSFDAPIVLITAADGRETFLGGAMRPAGGRPLNRRAERDGCVCNTVVSADQVVIIADIAEEERFAGDPFLKAHGIRFCAAARSKIKTRGGWIVMCAGHATPANYRKAERALISVAESVMMAIELREPRRTGEPATPEAVSSK